MEYIGDIADYASNALTLSGMKVRYPAVVTCKDGSQYIEEYVNCETNLAEESLNAGEERQSKPINETKTERKKIMMKKN